MIVNNGLGPAFIDNFQVFYKREICEPDTALKTVFGDLIRNSSITVLGNGYAVPEKGTVVLFSINFLFRSESEIELVCSKIDDFDILIEYSSAYEKMLPLDSRLD